MKLQAALSHVKSSLHLLANTAAACLPHYPTATRKKAACTLNFQVQAAFCIADSIPALCQFIRFRQPLLRAHVQPQTVIPLPRNLALRHGRAQ